MDPGIQYIVHLDCMHDNAHFGAHALSYSGTYSSTRRGQPLYKTQLIIIIIFHRPPRRGPLYSRQNSWSQCVLYLEVPLYS